MFLDCGVDVDRHLGKPQDGIVAEGDLDALGRQHRDRLLDQARLRLGEDAAEILDIQRFATRRGSAGGPAIRATGRWLRDMERARGDEQDVVALHRPCLVETVVPSISGSRSRCTPSRETSAPPRPLAGADLVDLVEKHDAVVLDLADRLLDDRVLVDQLVALLGDEGA